MTIEAVNERLNQARIKKAQMEQDKDQHDKLRIISSKLEYKQHKAKIKLEKEIKDAEQLANVTFKSFVETIMKTRETSIDKKEKSIYNIENEIEFITEELNQVTQKLDILEDALRSDFIIKNIYDDVFNQKLSYLKIHGSHTATKIIRLENDEQNFKDDIRKLEKIIDLIDIVFDFAKHTKMQLREAADIIVTGVINVNVLDYILVKDYFKTNKMYGSELDVALHKLVDESQNHKEKLKLDQNDFGIEKYIFGSSISDLLIPSKVIETAQHIDNLCRDVNMMKINISNLLVGKRKKRVEVKKEIETIVLNN